MTEVYILTKEGDYLKDGYSILGVFMSAKAIKEYITKNYPDYFKDGDSYERKVNNKFTDKEYLFVNKTELYK